jgi:hypothetical protein
MGDVSGYLCPLVTFLTDTAPQFYLYDACPIDIGIGSPLDPLIIPSSMTHIVPPLLQAENHHKAPSSLCGAGMLGLTALR